MNNTLHPLIIIGSGPAGLTAAIYAGRANLKPLIIEGTKPGGQLMGTTAVENWPGNISIMGPQLMMNMREHAHAQGAQFIHGDVTHVNFAQKPFLITTNKQQTFQAHAVIIATGATPKRLECPGEEQYWAKGVTTCAVCDGAFYKDQPVVIIGGGDTAMEDASFMTNFTNDITIVQIFDHLTASQAMQQRILENKKINIIYNSTVVEFKGNNDHLTTIVIKNQKTGTLQEIPACAAFLAIGLNPNTEYLKSHIDLLPGGYLKLSDHTKTSVDGVFGAGDVHDFRYRQAITSAGAGCMAALDAERYLKSIL